MVYSYSSGRTRSLGQEEVEGNLHCYCNIAGGLVAVGSDRDVPSRYHRNYHDMKLVVVVVVVVGGK